MCINALIENILHFFFQNSEKNKLTLENDDSDDESVLHDIHSVYSNHSILLSKEIYTMNPMVIEPIYTKKEIVIHLTDILHNVNQLYPQNIMLLNIQSMQIKLVEQYDSYLKLLSEEAINKIRYFERNMFSPENNIGYERIQYIGVNAEMNIVYIDTRYENTLSHIFYGIKNGVVQTTRIQFQPNENNFLSHIPVHENDIIYTMHYISYILSQIYNEQISIQKPIVFDIQEAIKSH